MVKLLFVSQTLKKDEPPAGHLHRRFVENHYQLADVVKLSVEKTIIIIIIIIIIISLM